MSFRFAFVQCHTADTPGWCPSGSPIRRGYRREARLIGDKRLKAVVTGPGMKRPAEVALPSVPPAKGMIPAPVRHIRRQPCHPLFQPVRDSLPRRKIQRITEGRAVSPVSVFR